MAVFAQALHELKGNVLIDPLYTSWWVQQQMHQASVKLITSPISLLKACKNRIEIDSMSEAHRLDGIALVKFIVWLQAHGLEGFDEVSLAEKLDSLRRLNDKYIGKSFETISAFGPNGAICHYAPKESTALTITDESLYLLDSGGQYYYGTTDITRTFHLGVPTTEQMQHYTLVLKGHLALRHTIFPHGTRGEHLDVIARHALWARKLNYGHGTGHGVGAYLCVHEGPATYFIWPDFCAVARWYDC
jgi:Xaa-Pro aminopeptidase